MNKQCDDGNGENPAETGQKTPPPGKKDPQWTEGLKRIYDSVLEEPMPDSFKDLLSRLDDGDSE